MDEILYLEPDEEITSVVDKLKGLEADSVGLVAPKGSSIVQSLVSLKLLQKQAKELGKEIAIVTSDEVGQNLAGRINLPVYADVRSRKPIEVAPQKEPEESGPIEITDEPAEAEIAAEGLAKKEKAKEIEEKQEKALEKTKAAKANQPDEYKDLPKSFEVHRYDEPAITNADEEELADTEPQTSESDETKTEEKINMSEKTKDNEDTDRPRFINRPLAERKEDHRMELESARPIIHEKKQVINPKKESRKKAVLAIIGIILLLAVVLLADLAFAKLKISLSVPADPINKEVNITVEKDHPNPDYEGGIINGSQIDKEVIEESEYTATGEKETGEPAKGILTIQNELGGDVVVNSGSTIKSSSGVGFTSDQSVTVPKATLDAGGNKVLGKTTVAVTASQAGITANLPANTSYVVEGKTGLSLTGSTSGGSTKKVKVVTKSDIDSAKKDSVSKAVDKFKSDTKADGDIILLDDAFTAETSSFTTTKNANDQADNFKATAKVRIVTLTFSKKEFTQAVIKAAEKDLPEGKSLLVTDQDKVDPALDENQINIGKLKVKGQFTSHIGPKIDLDKMITGFRFKPLKKIRSELEAIPGATIKEVKIEPNYALGLGPLLKKNTQIQIEYTNK